jgi:hypothetical protein
MDYKIVKICDENIEMRKRELSRLIDFDGKFIVVKSLIVEFIDERLQKWKSAVLKEIYISPDFKNS